MNSVSEILVLYFTSACYIMCAEVFTVQLAPTNAIQAELRDQIKAAEEVAK